MATILVRRRKRDTDEMPFKFEVSRSRTITFDLPEDVPFDDADSDRIESELEDMDPKPDEVRMPVASGLGDLVCSSIAVTFVDDKREDWELMLEIEEAVRRGLGNRAWALEEGYPEGVRRSQYSIRSQSNRRR